MHRALKAMLADTPLVTNLDNPEYMAVLLDGKASLEELFAQMGPPLFAGEVAFHAETGAGIEGYRYEWRRHGE